MNMEASKDCASSLRVTNDHQSNGSLVTTLTMKTKLIVTTSRLWLKVAILPLLLFTLGSMTETKADPVSLGAASGFTVLGINNTKISINGGNGVHGTVGSNGQIALDNPSNIFGDVVLGSGGSFKSTAQLPVNSTQNAALIAQAAADAKAASAFAAGLAATNSLTSIHFSNSSQTIIGGAMVNVLNLTEINLNHGTLILSAPAGGSF